MSAKQFEEKATITSLSFIFHGITKYRLIMRITASSIFFNCWYNLAGTIKDLAVNCLVPS